VFADTFIRADHVRAAAGWAFPTEFSAFLCLTGFLVIDVFRARWGTFGMIAAGVLVTASVIATQSRSGLIGLVAGALMYLLLQRRLGQGLRVIGALGAALLLLLVLPGAAPESFRTFVAQSLTPGSGANATVTYRQELYHDAAAALADRPWFGYGYGSGRSVATNALGSYFGDLTDLASLPVSMSVQIGYLGTAAVALILVWTLFKLTRATDVMARLPLAAGLLGCAVAMSGVPLSSPVTLMLLLVGLGWQLCSKTSADDPPEAPALETPGDASHVGTAPVAADHQTNSGTA
jgi:O-antigen ligase